MVGLNGILIYLQMGKWAEAVENPMWIYGTVGPLAVAMAAFLGWVAFYPYIARREEMPKPAVTANAPT